MNSHKPNIEELRYELTRLVKKYKRDKVIKMLFDIIPNPYPESKPKKIGEIGRWQE